MFFAMIQAVQVSLSLAVSTTRECSLSSVVKLSQNPGTQTILRRRREDAVVETKQIVQRKTSKERKARFRTCGWTGGLRDQDSKKKIDMKEGYRPAAAEKEKEGREAESISRQPTASGAALT